MKENKKLKTKSLSSRVKSSISQAKSYQEMGEFWDTHDLTEFWDQTEAADFEVEIQSEVAIHSEMADWLTNLTLQPKFRAGSAE